MQNPWGGGLFEAGGGRFSTACRISYTISAKEHLVGVPFAYHQSGSVGSSGIQKRKADLPYFREVLAAEPDAASLVASSDPAAWSDAIMAVLSRSADGR
jgi:hypothetical protein